MKPSIATVVDGGALLDTALAALAGGLFVTLAFSIAIYGMTKSADLRRSGRDVAAFGAATLGVCGLVVSIAAVVVGLGVTLTG